MDDFAWRPLLNQVEPAGGTVPSSLVALVVEEVGQPVGEVGPIAIVAEVPPSSSSSILAKKKKDDGVGLSSHKKSKAFFSLRALRQAAGLMPSASRLSTVQDVPPAPPTVEAHNTLATLAPSPPPPINVLKDTPTAIEVTVLATQADSTVAPSSTVVAPLLSAGVATIGAPMVLPSSAVALVASLSAILATVASPSLSSRPRVSLDHLYTSSDVDSLWGATYKPEQKTPIGFMSASDENLIRLARV